MAQSWSAILQIDRIGVHDNFFELGGDSLQATILLNRLQEHLGEAMPGHVLFQVQTINDLADYLRQHCPGAVRRQLSPRSGRRRRAAAAQTAAPAAPTTNRPLPSRSASRCCRHPPRDARRASRGTARAIG